MQRNWGVNKSIEPDKKKQRREYAEEPKGSARFATELVDKLAERCLGSDGRYLWTVASQGANSPIMVLSSGRPYEEQCSLDYQLFKYIDRHYANPLEILLEHEESTRESLLAQLAAQARLVRWHSTSQLFLFNNSTYVTFSPEKRCFARVEPGTPQWRELCAQPHVALQVHQEWRPAPASSERSLLDRVIEFELTDYLFEEGNSMVTVASFYAWLGQLLHKPGYLEQWNRSIAIDVEGGGSGGLFMLVKRLFDCKDATLAAQDQLGSLEARSGAPIQLLICDLSVRPLPAVKPAVKPAAKPLISPAQTKQLSTMEKKGQGRKLKAKSSSCRSYGAKSSVVPQTPGYPCHLLYTNFCQKSMTLPPNCSLVLDSNHQLDKMQTLLQDKFCELLHLIDEVYRHTIGLIGPGRKAWILNASTTSIKKTSRLLNYWMPECLCHADCKHKQQQRRLKGKRQVKVF